MKTRTQAFALAVLGAVTTASFAVTPAPAPDISITGTSTQHTSLSSMGVSNTSNGNTEAFQNLASNSGNVTISGHSLQMVTGSGGMVMNTATGGADAYASQNLSSNVGDVTIQGHSTQMTHLQHAVVANLANGAQSKAVQNISSNNACFTCQPTGWQGWPH